MKSPSVADQLVAGVKKACELFHDPTGEPWAWDSVSKNTFPIGSPSFDERLVESFYRATGQTPTPSAITQAVQTLRGLARYEGREVPVSVRIGQTVDGLVVLDLADPDRRAVVVSQGGWEVADDFPVRFFRPEGMLPLPVPIGGGDLDELLGQIMRPIEETGLVLAEGWLLAFLMPDGSKPVLMLSGEQGSGKTERARTLRSVLDPNGAPLRTMPDSEQDLAIMARRSAVLAFDNVSMLTGEQSDMLCRLTTGGGFSTRRLYSDQDEVLFQATRPVVLTSIPDVDRQPDLADRSLHVTCERLADSDRRTERDLHAAFEQAHPRILGALLDAVAHGLANVDATHVPELPRMADLALHVTAAEPALGHAPGTFVQVYRQMGDDVALDAIDGSPVGRHLLEVAKEGFAGTATQLLDRVESKAGYEASRRRGWPATARGLAGIVRRLAPSLQAAGYAVEFERSPHTHTRERIIRLTYLRHEGEPAEVLDVHAAEDGEDVQEVVLALVAAGIQETWPASKTAGLALEKSNGNAFLAARVLNRIGFPAPDGGHWTAVKIRGVT